MKNQIWDKIKESNSILLLTHESPDGDAIGSVLAFYHYLTSINKAVDMVILDIPNVFNFLPAINKIVDSTNKEYDLGIVVDCAAKERIGSNDDLLVKCKYTICVDHHLSNTKYCDLNFVDGGISSCCQIIYYLFKEFNISFNKLILDALMCGVITDTNGFSINSVDKDTFNMASQVLDFDVNIHELYDRLLCKKTIAQHKLTKIGMDRLELICDGKIAFTYILKEDFENVMAHTGDHEGIVNIGRNIEGVLVSVFIREDNGFTFSLRSTGAVDVSKIALTFGGGGHFMAAGGKLYGSLKETKETLINEIKKGFL